MTQPDAVKTYMSAFRQKMEEIGKRMDEKGWEKCPACSREWTGLRVCRFLHQGKTLERLLCPDCADTPEGLPFVAKEFPMGFEIEVGKRRSRSSPANYATVRYNSLAVSVSKTGIALAVTPLPAVPGEAVPSYDHVYRAYFGILEAFDRSSGSKPSEGWKEPVKRGTERRKWK